MIILKFLFYNEIKSGIGNFEYSYDPIIYFISLLNYIRRKQLVQFFSKEFDLSSIPLNFILSSLFSWTILFIISSFDNSLGSSKILNSFIFSILMVNTRFTQFFSYLFEFVFFPLVLAYLHILLLRSQKF